MNSKTSKIISFRVPQDLAEKIDKQAQEKGKKRSDFVSALFFSGFKKLLKQKPTVTIKTN